MKVWILLEQSQVYGATDLVEVLSVYDSELGALRELNKKFDGITKYKVVEYEVKSLEEVKHGINR